MSIITQALKKAQREQRQHHHAVPSSRLPLQPLATSRHKWRWLFVLGGCAMIFGVGLLVQHWRTRPLTPTLAMIAQPSPALLQDRPSASALNIPSTGTTPNRAIPPAHEPPPQVPNPTTLSRAEPQPLIAALAAPAPVPGAHQAEPTIPASLVLPASPLTLSPKPAATQTKADPSPKADNHSQAEKRFNKGLAALQAGDLTTAEQGFLQAIALNPSLKEAYNSLGNLYYQRETYSHAKMMYQHALELDPDYVNARNNLGNTYMQLAMHDEAIAELRQVISVNRESSLAYYNLACVYARTGDETLAAQYLNQAIKREPQARTWARTDTDFTPVRSTPEFQKLLGAS